MIPAGLLAGPEARPVAVIEPLSLGEDLVTGTSAGRLERGPETGIVADRGEQSRAVDPGVDPDG